MRRNILPMLVLGSALMSSPAWALTDADTGAEWLQATVNQKIAVTNILSRELGGDPRDYQTCLDQFFTPGSPNLAMTIRNAARVCRPRQ